MKKFWKLLAGLAATGTVIGLAILFFKKKDDGNFDLDDDDFAEDDLDMDLQPVKNREYVPLKKNEPEGTETASDVTDNAVNTAADTESREEPNNIQ